MKHLVIFNIYDHESLTASYLLSRLLKDAPDAEEVDLLDIRDALTEADVYHWVGCGAANSVASYYKGSYPDKTVSAMLAKSTFFNRSEVETGISGSLHFKIANHFYPDDFSEERAYLARWSDSAASYHTLDISAEAIKQYERLISSAYEYYTTGKVSSVVECHPGDNTDTRVSPGSSFKGYLLERSAGLPGSKQSNLTATRKTREFFHGMVSYTSVTDTSVHLYNLLRRLTLSNRRWFHVSSGLYKEIIYTNSDLSFELEERIHLLKRQYVPDAAPVRAAVKNPVEERRMPVVLTASPA